MDCVHCHTCIPHDFPLFFHSQLPIQEEGQEQDQEKEQIQGEPVGIQYIHGRGWKDIVLPRTDFEPVIIGFLDQQSTNWVTEATQLAGLQICNAYMYIYNVSIYVHVCMEYAFLYSSSSGKMYKCTCASISPRENSTAQKLVPINASNIPVWEGLILQASYMYPLEEWDNFDQTYV